MDSKKQITIKIRHFLYLFVLLGLDQLVKYWVRTELSGGREIVIIPSIIKFTYVKNTGAAFGILKGQVFPLAIVSVAALSILLWFYHRVPKSKRFAPLKLIIVFVTAGALGNLIDRIVYGFVTDFIYFELIDFPVFNIADMYLTVSVFFLILLSLFYYKEDEFDCFSIKQKTAQPESDISTESENKETLKNN